MFAKVVAWMQLVEFNLEHPKYEVLAPTARMSVKQPSLRTVISYCSGTAIPESGACMSSCGMRFQCNAGLLKGRVTSCNSLQADEQQPVKGHMAWPWNSHFLALSSALLGLSHCKHPQVSLH